MVAKKIAQMIVMSVESKKKVTTTGPSKTKEISGL